MKKELLKDIVRGKKRFVININGVKHSVSKTKYFINDEIQEYFEKIQEVENKINALINMKIKLQFELLNRTLNVIDSHLAKLDVCIDAFKYDSIDISREFSIDQFVDILREFGYGAEEIENGCILVSLNY